MKVNSSILYLKLVKFVLQKIVKLDLLDGVTLGKCHILTISPPNMGLVHIAIQRMTDIIISS